MQPVHRVEDGELCGYVDEIRGTWVARTAFGGILAPCASFENARSLVLSDGLAALAERWMLRDRTGGIEEIVCIQEVSADGVRVALGYYSMPGVPTRVITTAELATGAVVLERLIG
jgi:hypothetical protein